MPDSNLNAHKAAELLILSILGMQIYHCHLQKNFCERPAMADALAREAQVR